MLLIFDLDGTIMDTWEEIKLAFEITFSKRGINLNEKNLRMAVGLPLNEVIKYLTGNYNENLVEEVRNAFLSIEPRKIKMFDGIQKVIDLPVKKAVLTSKGNLGTFRDLKYLGIKNKFQYIVTADMVKNKKPDPEGILKILENLKEKPEDTFMIGDTELDILAAKSAGIKSVAVTWGNRTEEFLKKYNPDFIVKNPEEIVTLVETYAHL